MEEFVQPKLLLLLAAAMASVEGCKTDAEKYGEYRRGEEEILRATQGSERHEDDRAEALQHLRQSVYD